MIVGPHTWFLYSMVAAVAWGLSYALSERVMREGIPPVFLMVFTATIYLLSCVFLAFFMDGAKEGWATIMKDRMVAGKLIFVGALHVLGTMLVFFAISLKNATLASLIEISYPVFVCMFAYILYKDIQVNAWTALGGLLIFGGVSMIYLKA